MQDQTLLERVRQMREELRSGSAAVDRLDTLLAEVEKALGEAHDPVTSALRTLSYSEHQALAEVVAALPEETGGLLVASKVADRASITRSVIVTALRKLESAGVIEARSLGMKGTHIRFKGGVTARALRERMKGFNRRVA